MGLQAIIFDMDGVLTATVEYHYRSWKEALEEYAIPFEREQNEKLLGLTRRRSLEVILGSLELPKALSEALSEKMIQDILQQKNQIYLSYVDEMGPQDLLPGAQVLLQELAKAGLVVGVASASRNTERVLQRLGIRSLIAAVSDGNSVNRSKPAPDVFLKAADALGVRPSACIALEDSSPGILAALDGGMCVVGLGPFERVAHAHAVYPGLEKVHLEDLVEIYERWRISRPPFDSKLLSSYLPS